MAVASATIVVGADAARDAEDFASAATAPIGIESATIAAPTSPPHVRCTEL
jgi:hypothetical protein